MLTPTEGPNAGVQPEPEGIATCSIGDPVGIVVLVTASTRSMRDPIAEDSTICNPKHSATSPITALPRPNGRPNRTQLAPRRQLKVWGGRAAASAFRRRTGARGQGSATEAERARVAQPCLPGQRSRQALRAEPGHSAGRAGPRRGSRNRQAAGVGRDGKGGDGDGSDSTGGLPGTRWGDTRGGHRPDRGRLHRGRG